MNSTSLLENTRELDTCNKALLTIVSRGNAIITELFRLVDLVPSPFKQDKNQTTLVNDEGNKFSLETIVCDFSYFKNCEKIEATIESNDLLRRADEELCDKFEDIFMRFYLTFESIHRYETDLNQLVFELEEDAFVGQSLDVLIGDTEGLQLLCEAYFLLGYMLLVTDHNFEGSLRERLIVSYYRYSSYKSSPDSNFDETCNLMRTTGFKTPHQIHYGSSNENDLYYRPADYPESFFNRVSVNRSIVNLLVSKLQNVDIYNQTVLAFPDPDHRSAALSQQASILYLILYFCPDILKTQRSRMREITDKFFSDNWIISVYMGDIVNLIEAWAPYTAARESLTQSLDIGSTRLLIEQVNLRFGRVSNQVHDYLKEGFLNEQSVLESHSKILKCIRDANVILRWILLHSQFYSFWTQKLSRTVHSLVVENLASRKVIFSFLQNLAELEKRFSFLYDNLLKVRVSRIEENKSRAGEILQDLVSIFNDPKPNRWMKSGTNSNLARLIETARRNLDSIDITNQRNTKDLMVKLINRIDSARNTYSDDKSLHVVQLFMDAKNSLLQILQYLSLSDRIKIVLQTVGDFSYAWKILIESFTCHMQQIIKDEPLKIGGLKATFLKLASSFDTHLIRIQQVDSQVDLVSVSQYYSTKLVAHIRDVLQIVPITILGLITSIVALQANSAVGSMPSRISLDSLKDYAAPEDRFQLIELTYKISHYAQAVMLMENTTIGLIRIKARQLLEDGIRRALVQRMSESIQSIIQFDEISRMNEAEALKKVSNNLLSKLERLTQVVKGYRCSFEYIQDYLSINGLLMCQEELGNIVRTSVDPAAMTLINAAAGINLIRTSKNREMMPHLDFGRLYEPTMTIYGLDTIRMSFMVRLIEIILEITDPRATIYDEQTSAWYEQKTSHDQVVDLKVFELVASGLGIAGLNGVDHLCCCLLMLELQKIDSYVLTTSQGSSSSSQDLATSLSRIRSLLHEFSTITNENSKCKTSLGRLFSIALMKIAPHSDKITDHLLRIGQLQAIRNNIACVLSTKCRYEARNLYNCLETLNTTLLASFKNPKPDRQIADVNKCSTSNVSCQQDGNITATHISSSNDDIGYNNGVINNSSTTNDARGSYPEEDFIDASQLVFDLTKHLEWVGLSDPTSKLYKYPLNSSPKNLGDYNADEGDSNPLSIEFIFLIILDCCTKLQFSHAINGLTPKQSKVFYESQSTIDGQPLFYGIITLLDHYGPQLTTNGDTLPRRIPSPIEHLLKLMSLYIRHGMSDCCEKMIENQKLKDLSLHLKNAMLSVTELIRLSRRRADDLLLDTFLPNYLANNLQFTSIIM